LKGRKRGDNLERGVMCIGGGAIFLKKIKKLKLKEEKLIKITLKT
jgi:hypothetical protein